MSWALPPAIPSSMQQHFRIIISLIPFQTTLPDQTAASAQAANGVTPSTTEQPAVDELVFGDGVIDGMCATPSDSDDDAEECEHGTDAEATDA